MSTVLMTAYAVNPYKGSEEGTGWNLVCQSAENHKVIAVTRKNNKADIVRYMNNHPEKQALFSNMQFLHFDLPKWMIWWKKGPLLSALYFYIWQFSVACWLKRKKLVFDIAHSVNFHSNWTPSFLWMLGKPFVWGPVGNHPLIPAQYITKVYGYKAYLKDRMLWLVKWVFWNLDPFVYTSRKKAFRVFCVNSQAGKKLRLPEQKKIFMPAVASENPGSLMAEKKEQFTVLSVGRFVPLKGFDLTIRSFTSFYKTLTVQHQQQTKLLIIGTGPCKKMLQQIIAEENMQHAIEIKEWMPRVEVIDIFRQSAVYLFPSHEGAGMVVAEAMSYGLPVVCLDNYGPGEYIHPSSSLKIKQGSYTSTVHALAAALGKLFADPALYTIESNLSVERYRAHFTWPVKGAIMNAVYNQALAATGNTSAHSQPLVAKHA